MRGPLATATPYRSLQIPAPVIPANTGIHPLPRVGAIRESPSLSATWPWPELRKGFLLEKHRTSAPGQAANLG